MNNEMVLNCWVEERMAALHSESTWQPNIIVGLARLRERRRGENGWGGKWVWAAVTMAVAAAIYLGVAVLPAPRVLAQRCLQCSVAVWESFSSQSSAPADIKPEKGRKIPPDFTLHDASGESVQLSQFKGRVVLLNFWATWCGGCQVEIPWFIEFEKKYKDSGLTVIGVSMDDDGWTTVKPYLEERKVNYRIVIGNEDLAKVYGVEEMPVYLLIDRDGKIAASHTGLVSKGQYETEIQLLLKKKAVTTADSTN